MANSIEFVQDKRRAWLILALVSGFGLLARFACVTLLDITPISDFASYLQLASNLYDGEGLRDNRHGAYALYSAGYSLYMYLIFLVAGKSINTVQIFNALLGLCAILMVYSIGASIARSRWVGIVAALAWALYLPAILYTEYLAKENLMTLVLLAHMRLMVALPNSKNPNVLSALFGLLAGVQAVVGPAALAIVPVFLIQLLLRGDGFRKSILPVFIVLVTALVTVSPWLYRNYLLFGSPVLSTSGHNLYIGNNPNATGMFVQMRSTPKFEGWVAARTQGELVASRYAGKAAMDYIAENPGRTVLLALKKAILFWTPPLHGSKYGVQSAPETVLRILWAIQYLLACGLAFLFVFFIRPDQRKLALILYASIACYTGIHMVFFVILRYRLPIMPLVCILAAWCVHEIVMRRVRKRQRVEA